jgi:hypothetical protein
MDCQFSGNPRPVQFSDTTFLPVLLARCCQIIGPLSPNSLQIRVSTLSGGTIGQIARSRCSNLLGAGAAVSSNAEEFRKRADECYRLSVQLRNPEHKSVALYLAAAWLELAQKAERQEAEHDRTIPTSPPADPQPKDQVE